MGPINTWLSRRDCSMFLSSFLLPSAPLTWFITSTSVRKKNHFENPLSLYSVTIKTSFKKKKMNRPVSPTHFIAFPLFDWAGLFMDYLKKHFKWKTGKKHFQELAWLIFFWLTSTRLFVCRLQSKQSTDN